MLLVSKGYTLFIIQLYSLPCPTRCCEGSRARIVALGSQRRTLLVTECNTGTTPALIAILRASVRVALVVAPCRARERCVSRVETHDWAGEHTIGAWQIDGACCQPRLPPSIEDRGGGWIRPRILDITVDTKIART